jgi:ABC-type Fe3+-hydroxamate transport system substrate-binding protein
MEKNEPSKNQKNDFEKLEEKIDLLKIENLQQSKEIANLKNENLQQSQKIENQNKKIEDLLERIGRIGKIKKKIFFYYNKKYRTKKKRGRKFE